MFEIGGVAIRCEFAGTGLESVVTRALAHLEREGRGAGTLRLRGWDTASTGVALSPPTLSPDDYGPLGEILPIGDASTFATFTEPGVLSVFERETGTGTYWTADASRLPGWERAAPARSLLGAMLRSRARHIVHGAAVGWNGAGALIVGDGGTGKSSTAMACLDRGMAYLGDDYCAISLSPEPTVHSLFSSAKLFPKDARNVSPDSIREWLGNSGDDKEVLYLASGPERRLPPSLPLRAFLAPRFSNGVTSSVTAIHPIRAVLPALTSTAAQTPGTGGELLSVLSTLSRRVPCFELRLGSDRRGVADVVRDTLERLS